MSPYLVLSHSPLRCCVATLLLSAASRVGGARVDQQQSRGISIGGVIELGLNAAAELFTSSSRSGRGDAVRASLEAQSALLLARTTFKQRDRRTFAQLPPAQRRTYLALDSLVTSLSVAGGDNPQSISKQTTKIRAQLPLAGRFPVVVSVNLLHQLRSESPYQIRIDGIFPALEDALGGPTLEVDGRRYRAPRYDSASIVFDVATVPYGGDRVSPVPILVSIPWNTGRWWEVGPYRRLVRALFTFQLFVPRAETSHAIPPRRAASPFLATLLTPITTSGCRWTSTAPPNGSRVPPQSLTLS